MTRNKTYTPFYPVPSEREYIPNTKILVTDGAVFFGPHLRDAYLAEGHEVAVLDDMSRGSTSNVNPRARFYRGDTRDRTLRYMPSPRRSQVL